jgi:glycine/serine hydroxymethyltransferase
MKEKEMTQIGEMMSGILERIDDKELIEQTRLKVRGLCEQFPFHMEMADKY